MPHPGGFYIEEFICSPGSADPSRPCRLDADCPGGACIVRPDFIFADADQRICAVSTFWAEFIAGCTLVAPEGGAIQDGGSEYYLVTAEYDVSADARGEFTLGVRIGPHESFLSTESRRDLQYTLQPLVITVEPAPATGACCDCSERDVNGMPVPACIDSTTQSQCQGASQTWSEGWNCAEVACDCGFEPIPTASEWGLAVLVLSLLVVAKVAFGRWREIGALDAS